jgi:6-phosphogluconolactonase
MTHFQLTLAGFLTILSVQVLPAKEAAMWIGSGTPQYGEKSGVYRSTLDLEKGTLTKPKLALEIGAPEFLAIHPDGSKMYAACELEGGKPGVAAIEISSDRQSLRLLNTQPINDGGACHICLDREGKCIFTAQYGSGTVAVFPLDADGRIKRRSQLIKHSGTGPDKSRQEAAHPHYVGTDPGNRFLFVPDLGTDKIMIYEMDLANGQLKTHGHAKCAPGSGPRHFVFHPNSKFAYVVNEMALTVTAFKFDAKAGTLTEIQTIDTLPKDLREVPSSTAEIYFHPSGKFLYASNRDHDSITALRVDDNSGKLSFVEREPVRGSHPRNFHLDPTGRWLVAAGLFSNTVAVFDIDQKTGGMVFRNVIVNSPAPMCVDVQAVP